MLAVALFTTLMAWWITWAIGLAASRLLFTRRHALVESAAPLPLGLAVACSWLEGSGYFLPIRIAAWGLLLPAAAGVWMMFRARSVVRSACERAAAATSLFALGLGLYPVVVAGRFTSAALTNNDSTYYLTAADRLLELPWRVAYDPIPVSQCLVERVLHVWNWRVGTPNLMAALSAVSGLSTGASLAVVTALLLACVPPAAISIARGAGGVTDLRRALVVGALGAGSAAPLWVGYQHMTGNLAACSLFPLSLAAALGAVRSGGLRRTVYASLFFGAGVAFYADGSAVLLVIAMAVLLANFRGPARAAGRLALIAGTTAAVAPFTVIRVVRTTVKVTRASLRVVSETPLKLSDLAFPQRGWLPRSVVDDLSTLTGVDPWPPWPAAAPPNLQTVVTWAATCAGLVLLGFGVNRLSRRDERIAGAVFGAVVVVSLSQVEVWYLRGKILLMAAAFVTPILAVGAASALPRRLARGLAVLVGLGELFALSQLVDRSRWKVVDRPEHDALVPQLSRVPRGSLVAFDGLGAPTDVVLDSHRAYRAALLADLIPIQPGLDGGFYVPELCPRTERPDPLPPRAYALQRLTSETLTVGDVVSSWGDFRLLRVDLRAPAGFVAAWAPTHGFMAAEREPDGRVFRWAESSAKGTLQVMTRAPCVRLAGELRVLAGTARVDISVDGHSGFFDDVAETWKVFHTAPFPTQQPVSVELTTRRMTGSPPDAAHAIAASRLSVEPASCGSVRRIGGEEGSTDPLVEIRGGVALSVEAPKVGACAALKLVVSSTTSDTLKITVDENPPVVSYLSTKGVAIVVPLGPSGPLHRVTIGPIGEAPEAQARITDATVLLQECL